MSPDCATLTLTLTLIISPDCATPTPAQAPEAVARCAAGVATTTWRWSWWNAATASTCGAATWRATVAPRLSTSASADRPSCTQQLPIWCLSMQEIHPVNLTHKALEHRATVCRATIHVVGFQNNLTALAHGFLETKAVSQRSFLDMTSSMRGGISLAASLDFSVYALRSCCVLFVVENTGETWRNKFHLAVWWNTSGFVVCSQGHSRLQSTASSFIASELFLAYWADTTSSFLDNLFQNYRCRCFVAWMHSVIYKWQVFAARCGYILTTLRKPSMCEDTDTDLLRESTTFQASWLLSTTIIMYQMHTLAHLFQTNN